MNKYDEDEYIDEGLRKSQDTRNVVDRYRNWKVAAIKADVSANAFPVHIAIENYQHDYNIGTIVRSANAFAVSGVHIIGKRHWNRRGAMATEKYLELYHHPDVPTFIEWGRSAGLDMIGIDNTPNFTPLDSAVLPRAAILVFGQEGPGLSVAMQAACQRIVGITQYGSTRSVNVGVAAGIVLYEYVRQHAVKTID